MVPSGSYTKCSVVVSSNGGGFLGSIYDRILNYFGKQKHRQGTLCLFQEKQILLELSGMGQQTVAKALLYQIIFRDSELCLLSEIYRQL